MTNTLTGTAFPRTQNPPPGSMPSGATVANGQTLGNIPVNGVILPQGSTSRGVTTNVVRTDTSGNSTVYLPVNSAQDVLNGNVYAHNNITTAQPRGSGGPGGVDYVVNGNNSLTISNGDVTDLNLVAITNSAFATISNLGGTIDTVRGELGANSTVSVKALQTNGYTDEQIRALGGNPNTNDEIKVTVLSDGKVVPLRPILKAAPQIQTRVTNQLTYSNSLLGTSIVETTDPYTFKRTSIRTGPQNDDNVN